jgi:hypothetical protein
MKRMSIFVLVALFAFPLVSVQADDSFGVNLLRRDSLAGWDHGSKAPSGWTIAGGHLTGRGSSTPLLSGWTFGDFELRLDWSTSGGQWKLLFPEVPAGRGLELFLAEGDQCGRLLDGDRQLAPGAKVGTVTGKPHTAVILRRAGKLTITVDGKRLADVGVQPDRRFGLGLAVQGGEATLDQIRGEEPAGESIFNGRDLTDFWTPGNPSAWAAKDGMIVWVKRGGDYLRSEREFANFTLSCEYKSAKGANSGIGIRTPRTGWPSADGMEMQLWDKPFDTPLDKHQTMAIYGNVPPLGRNDPSETWNRVVVKADGYMISAWMNGELVQQYNTFHHPELKWRHLAGWIGFQDHGGELAFRNIRVLSAPAGLGLDAWYAPQPTTATAAMIDRLMNSGRLAAADGITSGVVALHAGKPQRDEPPKAAPKKDDGKKKKAGDKKAASQKKQAPKKPADKPQQTPPAKSDAKPASKPEVKPTAKPEKTTLSNWAPAILTADPPAEPKKSEAPAKKPESKPASSPASSPAPRPSSPAPQTSPAAKKPELPRSDYVLAELSGPGAVVRIARGNSDGQLAFYFDGEKKPRLECTPAELWKAVPELSEDANPVTTCLTYAKSLKIVLKGATGADYRIDYVKFPAQYAMETFTGPESGFPRGWLSAIHFRLHHHKIGTVRKFSPLPEITCPQTTVAPQQTQPFVHINGTGIVHWLRLETPKQVLANSDLWLEVTVDGQSQPAISAPARFWFPGLVGQGNWQNFVMLERNGLVFRLGMPFGRGITVSARNAGNKPINEVGLTLSAQMATEGTVADIQGRMRLYGRFLPASDNTTELASLKGPGRWVGLVYEQPEGKPTGIDSLAVDGQLRPGWNAPDLDPFLGFLPPSTRQADSGRNGSLAWRYLVLECVDFRESMVFKATDKKVGSRLVWYYAK